MPPDFFDAKILMEQEHPRSPRWAHVRHEHLLKQSICQWCGNVKLLQVHHIQPYHLFRDLELDPKNLITLCEASGLDCHLKYGHFNNWRKFNPDILAQALAHQKTWPPLHLL